MWEGGNMEDLLVAVDVGNTETRFGLFAGAQLEGTLVFTTRERITPDEAAMQLHDALGILSSAEELPSGAILSCVVPAQTDAWREALGRVSTTRPLVVGPGLKTGVRMRYNDPSEVGSDRVADIVAAREALGAPVVAVDLGTTTNIEVVDAKGTFLGGVIAPGMRLGLRALSEAAARLPMIGVETPRALIGRSTREAMQSGVVYGEAARLDGLLDAVVAELGETAPVILTGDDAPLMAAMLRHEVTVDETLTLKGLALLWQRNRQQSGARPSPSR